MSPIAMRAIMVTEDFLIMTFEQFKTAILMSLGTALVAIAGFMATSLWSLNEKIAVVVSKVERHDDELKEIRVDIRYASELFRDFQREKDNK